MKLRKKILFVFFVFCVLPVFGQQRSFGELFPDFDETKKALVFSSDGITVSSESSLTLQLLPPVLSRLDMQGPVLRSNPSFLVESLMVIPVSGNPPDLLAVYNGLGKVRNLKGRLYHSFTRDEYVPLFEEATRLESARKLSAIPDPPPARTLPASETVYLRLKDINFGNSYYRGDITLHQYGLLYSLSNFKKLTYLIPVIKEGKFLARFYIEPLADGLMIYSISGADVSDFIASRVSMPSMIQKRLEVIIGWVIDGILAE